MSYFSFSLSTTCLLLDSVIRDKILECKILLEGRFLHSIVCRLLYTKMIICTQLRDMRISLLGRSLIRFSFVVIAVPASCSHLYSYSCLTDDGRQAISLISRRHNNLDNTGDEDDFLSLHVAFLYVSTFSSKKFFLLFYSSSSSDTSLCTSFFMSFIHSFKFKEAAAVVCI